MESSAAHEIPARGPEALSSRQTDSEKVLLGRSDYQKIKDTFERVMKRQGEMDQKLSDHRRDLETLGKALESATIVKESVKK
jgi:hypothetical protein